MTRENCQAASSTSILSTLTCQNYLKPSARCSKWLKLSERSKRYRMATVCSGRLMKRSRTRWFTWIRRRIGSSHCTSGVQWLWWASQRRFWRSMAVRFLSTFRIGCRCCPWNPTWRNQRPAFKPKMTQTTSKIITRRESSSRDPRALHFKLKEKRLSKSRFVKSGSIGLRQESWKFSNKWCKSQSNRLSLPCSNRMLMWVALWSSRTASWKLRIASSSRSRTRKTLTKN